MSPSDRSTARTTALLRFGLAGVLVAALLAALIMLLPGRFAAEPAFHGTSYGEPQPAPPFRLRDHHGIETGLDDFRGRAVLLFFGFTNCPDVCPLTLHRLSRVVNGLGAAEDVRIVLITVDPERDTSEALAPYVARFGPQVTGLTGEADSLEAIRRAYGVYAERQPGHAEHAVLVHTTAVFGIDRGGRLRVLLHADGDEDALTADVRTLLRL